MKPGARFFFFIARRVLCLARWEGMESRLQSVLRRAAVLPILPAALFVFEPAGFDPVLVRPPVWHDGPIEALGAVQLLISASYSVGQVSMT